MSIDPSTIPTLRTRRALAGTAAGLAAAALVLVAPVAASAHVHVEPTSTEAGATAQLAFSFSHGCDGSPTTAIEVAVPDAIGSIALIANPGWQVSSELDEGIRTVVLTADRPVPDGVRETLEVEVTLPEGAADGTVLAFPTLQVCQTGQTLWGDADPASETPAPMLTVGEAADAHGDGAASGTGAEGHGQGTDGPSDAGADGTGTTGTATTDAATDAAAAQPSPQPEQSAAMPLAIAALVVAVAAAALAAVAVFRRRPRA